MEWCPRCGKYVEKIVSGFKIEINDNKTGFKKRVASKVCPICGLTLSNEVVDEEVTQGDGVND